MYDDFIELRQILTQKRKYILKRTGVVVHPSINENILDEINNISSKITNLITNEYHKDINYQYNTLGNCYALSILFNLFNDDYKLIQGGIVHENSSFGIKTQKFYQHSWLLKDNIIYDPALRIVTPEYLYHMFFDKKDEYTKEETENILKRIGFNFTYFSDFINGYKIGNCESIMYYASLNNIDSEEYKEEAEKLLSLVKTYK